MTACAKILAASLAAVSFATPAAAQYPYPQPYQEPYQQPYQQPYQYPSQPGNVIGSVIDSLLGNRYNVTDRSAVTQCAHAAVLEAERQYRPYIRQGYEPYGGWGYNNIRVTEITDVQRKTSGLRVKGLLDSGLRYGMYNPGVLDPRYYGRGDLTFSCKVDWRGYVSDLRVRRRY
jgi:hypothetical protein